MERRVSCTYDVRNASGPASGSSVLPTRDRSFYENFALVLLYSILALVDAIQQINILALSVRSTTSAVLNPPTVPIQVPFVAAVLQSIISFLGAIQASAALLYTAHPAHAAALWRIAYCVLALYCVAGQLASQASTLPRNVDNVLAALAVAALRGAVLAAPADLGARADWPAHELHARLHAACGACFFAACCVIVGGMFAVTTGSSTGSGTYDSYGPYGRLPMITSFVGLILAFWAAAGSIICYSRSERAARIHALATAPVCVICIATFACIHPAFTRATSTPISMTNTNRTQYLTAATLGIGPEAAACLFLGAILLPCVYMAEQASCDKEKSLQDPDEIVINYP